jgi:hypothetical protein
MIKRGRYQVIRVRDNSRELGKAFDRVMKERAKEKHDFVPMSVGGMENICDKCYYHKDKGAHNEREGDNE